MKVILAHGIIGPLDELFYLSPGIIFVFTMTLGWLRSRKLRLRPPPRIEEHPAPTSETE